MALPCRIDHITVVSPSLQAGGEWVHQLIGVSPQQGGEHPRMGTHNLLLRLSESMFLEVISINPQAHKPARARWFELDRFSADSKPRLACWVAQTEDIHASLAKASEPLGQPEPMTRGSLEWLISIPQDGSLPLGGTAPVLIQWQTDAHPATRMPDMGCTLVKLELLHPQPQRLSTLIDSIQVSDAVSLTVKKASTPGLAAHLGTPQGLRTIMTLA